MWVILTLGSSLKGRIATFLPSLNTLNPLGFVAHHSSGEHDAALAGEDAGGFKLLQQPGNFVRETADHSGELLSGHGFACRVLEKAPAVALVHKAEHVDPESSRGE